MKRYKKLTRILALVFALGMLMSITGVAAYEFKSEFELAMPKDLLQQMRMQEAACQAGANLAAALPKDANGLPIYPDDYAGEYIDWEHNARLVIRLVNASETRKQYYLGLCKDSNVVFEDATYGWNSLCDQGRDYIETLIEDEVTVYCGYVSVKDNAYYIEVKEDRMTDARSVLLSSDERGPVRIVEGAPIVQCASIYGGSSIKNSTTNVTCTVGIGGGYFVSANYNDGYLVTCGHGNPLGSRVTYNGTQTGNVVYRSYSESYNSPSLGDFAIIDLTSNTAERKINLGGTDILTITTLRSPTAEGQVFLKYGPVGGVASCRTTGYCDYVITTSNGTGGNCYVTGVWACSATGNILPGDSGGPAYSGVNTLIGITTGYSQLGVYYITPIGLAANVGFTLS